MDLQMNAVNRLPCAEPLECRWLLSAAVQAVELGVPTDDNDIKLAVSALPAQVVAGLHAGFRGGELIAASFSDDTGPEFGVTIQFHGQIIEVTLTPGGEIIGTEEAISSEALPRPVLDWIRQNFQGGQINNATMASDSGILSYDVIIITRGGKEIEATLRIKDEPPDAPGTAAEKAADGLDDVPTSVRGAGTELSSSLADAADQEVLLESERSRNCGMFDPAAQGSGANSALRARGEPRMAASVDQTELARPLRENSGSGTDDQIAGILGSKASVLATLQAFAAGAGSTQWLPEVSGLLTDVLAMDVASIERGFGDILDKVESLAEQAVGDTAASSVASRLAVAGVLIAGVLFLRDARKSRGVPVLVYSAANSSWSWVLGASTPK